MRLQAKLRNGATALEIENDGVRWRVRVGKLVTSIHRHDGKRWVNIWTGKNEAARTLMLALEFASPGFKSIKAKRKAATR